MTEGIEQIGNVVGIPAALVVGWCVFKIKDLVNRVDILSKENSELKQTLSDIRADVSFIRGKLEKE